MILYAYQQEDSRDFVVKYSSGLMVEVPGFIPVEGRDKIRSPEGELEDYVDIVQLEESYNEGWYRRKKRSLDIFTIHELDHSKQKEIVLSDVFDSYSVYVVGCGSLGLEISLALMKLGVRRLTLCDDSLVEREDVASGSFRVFDPSRSRAVVGREILFDQTKNHALVGKVDSSIFPREPDGITRVVINTSPDRAAWNVMKGRKELYLDCQVYGESGVLYCVRPGDRESEVAYEESLGKKGSSDVIYMTKIMAGMVSYAMKKHAMSNPYAKSLENLYYVDLRMMFKE